MVTKELHKDNTFPLDVVKASFLLRGLESSVPERNTVSTVNDIGRFKVRRALVDSLRDRLGYMRSTNNGLAMWDDNWSDSWGDNWGRHSDNLQQ